MDILKSANAALAFAIELAMLAALGYAGYQLTGHAALRWALAIALPLIVIIIWGKWLAPNSATRLPEPWQAIAKLVLFGITTALLYKADKTSQAVLFLAVSYANTLLALAWKQ